MPKLNLQQKIVLLSFACVALALCLTLYILGAHPLWCGVVVLAVLAITGFMSTEAGWWSHD